MTEPITSLREELALDGLLAEMNAAQKFPYERVVKS